MREVSNPSVAKLSQMLEEEMERLGYSRFCIGATQLLSQQLSAFMEENAVETYDGYVGAKFQDNYCQHHTGKRQLTGVKLFVARINSMFNERGFVAHRKLTVLEELPVKLDRLLSEYTQHCTERGNSSRTVHLYENYSHSFLKLLADDGICDSSGITSATVSAAILHVTDTRAFPVIRAFLRFLAEEKYLSNDYSFLVPRVRPPQPIPSVYSVEEIQRIEAQVQYDAINGVTSFGKRDYAMLLMATRLGLRPCDIVSLTFSELDFQAEAIRIVQEKTDAPLELPMLPVIRDALLDYINHARGKHSSQYVFLSMQPPYSHVSAGTFSCDVRNAILAAGIDRNGRGVCARVFRSSLASSMVNDGVPYEVTRRTLGHRDKDAIRHYAKLDVEQLRLYALEPPAATGRFAEILSGRCSVK
ncbi:tyrosine-type recombinase/integrase [Oscillospiraceae bacterium 21-37]